MASRMSHGALSLIRLPLPIVPPPVPAVTSPGRLSSHQGRGTCPTVAGATRKPGVNQSHPGWAGRRPRWQVPSWRAIACELSTGLGAVCSVSAAAGESRALEAPCLDDAGRGDDEHEGGQAPAFFFPSTTAAGHVHHHHHHGPATVG
jgi:hypothetical protein